MQLYNLAFTSLLFCRWSKTLPVLQFQGTVLTVRAPTGMNCLQCAYHHAECCAFVGAGSLAQFRRLSTTLHKNLICSSFCHLLLSFNYKFMIDVPFAQLTPSQVWKSSLGYGFFFLLPSRSHAHATTTATTCHAMGFLSAIYDLSYSRSGTNHC